jgi:prophage DNA circulation protein
MAVPAWVDRLRDASFVSPSGVESFFKLDTLTRIGGKKASNHEILNKDEAIPQDQGNRSIEYPIEAYFTDENGDLEANAFFDSLGERYTAATPGILKHPIWGDIPVMPFEFQQVHQLVRQAGIFRVPVTFRPIPQAVFPTAPGIDQSEIVNDISDLEEAINEANAVIDVDDAGRFAEFSAKVKEVVSIVNDAIGEVAAQVDEIEDTFRQIQDDIDSAIAAGASAVEILSQVNRLIRLPGQIVTSTIGKIEAYATMTAGIATSFVGFFNPNSDRTTQLNGAVTFQSLISISTAGTTEAALFTDFETRDAAGDALDFINDAAILTEQRTSEIYQTLSNGIQSSFAPDHNTGLSLSLIVGKTNSILIDRSFDLKAKQIVILQRTSDPITETWKYYRSTKTEDIEFYIRTNNLQDNSIIEIPSGTETVVYV